MGRKLTMEPIPMIPILMTMALMIPMTSVPTILGCLSISVVPIPIQTKTVLAQKTKSMMEQTLTTPTLMMMD